jgi:hypothetical protein
MDRTSGSPGPENFGRPADQHLEGNHAQGFRSARDPAFNATGSSKTRLGLQTAAELLDGSGDGVWLAELGAISDEEEVPSAIAAALGIRGQPGKARKAPRDLCWPRGFVIAGG